MGALPNGGPLWSRNGLVGTNKQLACATGPAVYGEAFPEVSSELPTTGLTLWLCAPGDPTGIRQVFAAGKSSPNEETAKVPVLCVQPVDHGVDY